MALGQETVILQTTPATSSQRFNQAMKELHESLNRLGEARRQQEALGLQHQSYELEVKKFELEVLDRAIRFEKDYPGEANPYREFLASLRAPPPEQQVPTPASQKKSSSAMGLVGAFLIVGFVLLVGLAAGG